MIEEIRLSTIADLRITALTRVGVGEGFATYTAKFEGKPAFITDSGTMADFVDEEDLGQLVSVQVFMSDAAREEYLEHLARTTPGALGRGVNNK